MPKLTCPCGFVHDLSSIPDNGWKTVRDRDYDSLIELESRLLSDECDSSVRLKKVNLWGLLYLCPDCDRIMWQREERFRVFRSEDSG